MSSESKANLHPVPETELLEGEQMPPLPEAAAEEATEDGGGGARGGARGGEPSLRSRAISGTAWTLAGYGLSNVIRMGGNIVCSHILKTAPFGVMQLAMAVLQGIQMCSDVGIGPNIIQSKQGDDPRFLNTAWTVQVIRGVALWLLTAVLAYPISQFYNEPSLVYIIPLVGLSALFGGFNATAIFTLNKRLDVRRLTLMQLGSQLAGVIAMIATAIITRDAWALAAAAVVQAAVRLVLSHTIDPTFKNKFDWHKESLRSLLSFGSIVFISTVLTFVGMQGDRLVLGKLISMDELGIYGTALTISRLPLDVIVNIGSGVAFPAYSHAINTSGNFDKVFRKIRFPLCVSGSFAMAVCAIAGPELLRLIWPKEFHPGAELIPILCLGAMFQMLEITSSSALMAKGKVQYLAIGNAMRVATMIAGLVVGFGWGGLKGALFGLVIADAVRYLVSALFARREGLPIFRHDALLYALTLISYFAASFIEDRLPDLSNREYTLIEHILVDSAVIALFFAWPLWLVAKDFLGRQGGGWGGGGDGEKPLRVTFVIPSLGMQGGIRTVALYAEYLKSRGHTVTVIAPEVRSRSLLHRVKRSVGGVIKGGGLAPPINTSRAGQRPPSHFDGTDVNVLLLEKRGKVTARDVPDADVVIATWWETAEWVSEFPPSKGVQTYFVQGYEVWEGQPVRRVETTYHFPMRKVAVSDWLAGIMRERYGDVDTVVVPNGVDIERFSAPPRGKQRVPTVGFMFSEQSIKGSDLVGAAVAIVRKTIPNLRVLSFGTAPSTGRVPLPPHTEFRLRPPHDQLVATYAQCDAWIFASRSEGFGLPILEAMACRTPVIATPAGAAPQLVTRGGGILVGHEDVEGLANAILKVVQAEEEEWRRLSDIAHDTAVRFNRQASAAMFEAVLKDVVRRGHAVTPPIVAEEPLTA